ncbi:MAG: patatin-like phospholipase family protein [Ghiorsea sp.]|nr:patatin-like phospholipase family protein [Ghiorsea sp.]
MATPSDIHCANTRIGIALGSGSARGWSHIGVLNALAEMGIKPSVVAGCSIGALVGAAYASDQQKELEDWVRALTWKGVVSFLDLSMTAGGLIQGEKLMAFARSHMKETPIEELPCLFGAVATELDTGREVWLRKDSLLDAIRASISIPGLFAPVKLGGQCLVDGGLVNPVPVSLCRAMGADIIIAVNLNSNITGKYGLHRQHTKMKDEGTLWKRISGHLKSGLNERKAWLQARRDEKRGSNR